VVSQLNHSFSVRHPTLLCKYLRVHILECYFEYIDYFHVLRESNILSDSLANYVLE
jgi:hypothetical protein